MQRPTFPRTPQRAAIDSPFSKSLKYSEEKSAKESPHRYAGPVGEHPCGNVHRGQLLEQKLGGIGDMHLGDAVLVVAQPTLEEALFQLAVEKLVIISRQGM